MAALLKELHAANPRTILLLLTGGPISMTWEAANLPAIMTIWYGGQMMGQAVANALTGAVSPAGRSPFTWPTGLEQVPDELDMSPSTPPGKAHQTWCRLRSVETGRLEMDNVKALDANDVMQVGPTVTSRARRSTRSASA